MKAARLYGVTDLRIEEIPDLAGPDPGHSLVRVTAVGLCGSDLHWYSEGGIGDDQVDHPVVPGHEMGGVAVTGPFAGQRVAIDPAIPCGRCEQCRTGDHNLCPEVRFAGHGIIDGGLREFMLWPDAQLHPIPATVSDAGAALLEPLGVAIHTLDLSHLQLGADVLVTGAGPIGLLTVRLARLRGAHRIFVTEPHAHRRDAALSFGADAAWPVDDAAGAVLEAAGGRGVDVAIEAAGTDDAIATGIGAVRPGARVILAGIPDNDRMVVPSAAARRKGLTLVFVRRMRDVYPRAIALAASGLVDLDGLATARFSLSEAVAGFRHAAARNGLKTVITP